MNVPLLRALTLLVALGSLTAARAELMTFTLDPAQSSVSLSGSASGFPLQPQAPGSLTTTYAGTIVLDVGVAEVQFPGGSSVNPREENSWQPGPGGTAGAAPASYGGKAEGGSGFFKISAVAATRRLSFDLLSAPLAFNGGSFNAAGLQFQFVETNNPVLDYSVVSALLNQKASQALSGLATNKLAGASTLATAGKVQTLTIPVDATYRFKLLVPDDSVLQLTGQIVATRTIPDGTPEIVIEPVPPGANSMSLTWPAGFKLQKATRLLNPDWGDTGASSPATVPFATAGEYFQIVPQ